MDRSSIKKSKEKILAGGNIDKTKTPPMQQMSGRLSPPELSQPYPADIAIAYQNKMMSAGVGMPTVSQMNPDGLPDDCLTANGSFDGYTVPIFSGLVTPPSMESEPVPIPFMPHDQEWTPPMSDSQGFDYEERFPCLDNREQHWDQENLRRLLDMNMYLLDCQRSVSQKLLMLGNMSPTIAVHNLQTALQSVLAYSHQFLEVVACIQGETANPAACQVAASMTANGMIVPLPTPSQSRRPSCLPTGVETGLGQPETLAPQGNQTGRFEDVQISLILAIINCYTCLVGSYHIIFSYLLQELMANSPFAPQPSPIFPSFEYATGSEPNRELHLRCIFNNSMRMLAELETTLGLPERHSVASSPGQQQQTNRADGILASPSSSVLLDSLASQGFGLCVNGLATGKNSLKEIVQAINQFLEPV
ncbi:hypothetical protein PISL3812_03828 [Talaromyces islandicus]|uniref:Uncharacterized protein n=1 Tax=Talaromyces islandicus TaxID=28573 RepID=A0A0U1LVI9_TALIS|nr:hypothetical protein PISL3812_03828 [Talaromyces islandicus]